VDLSTLANLINAFAVTAGVIFAAVQIRHYRHQRQREAMLELVRSFQSPAFTSTLRRVLSLPDGADTKRIREVRGPDGEDAVYMVSLTWESLGRLVFRREVTLELVGDFFSGPILVSWRKLSRYVSVQRAILQRDTAFEWVEWLAERMMEEEKQAPPVPAHIAHRGWK
jgi:hypothetical protein